MSILDAGEKCLAKLEQYDEFHKAVGMMYALIEMQAALNDDGIAALMYLQGKPEAFKTDKPYPPDVVARAAISAILRGAYLVGNEFNIIAGQCYLTKEFYERKLRQYPGVTDLEIVVDRPVAESGMMICGGFARCRVKGKSVQVFARKTDQGDSRIAVTAYQNDVDNAAGKATKRLLQRLYERISGVTLSDVDTPVPAEPAKIETDTVSEPEHTIDELKPIDWKAELYQHGGPDSYTVKAGRRMYVAADSAEPMAGIAAELQEAAEAMAAKTIDQRAYATLERYGAWLLEQKEQQDA